METDLQKREQEVIDEFSLFDDWMGKYEHLIDQGRRLEPFDERFKTDEHKIHGCQSQVWVRAELKDGRIRFYGDSDTHITRGLVALLIRVLSGLTPAEVLTSRLDFLNKIGLQEHLSPTRKNGLAGMIRQIKRYALTYAPETAN